MLGILFSQISHVIISFASAHIIQDVAAMLLSAILMHPRLIMSSIPVVAFELHLLLRSIVTSR